MIARKAFTLVELLVVVTIIVILLALLTPAMDRAMQAAEKAVCASNLDAIGTSSTLYAMDNKRELFTCRGRNVQLTFSPDGDDGGYADAYGRGASDRAVNWLKAMSTVGLASSESITVPSGLTAAVTTEPLHVPSKVWYCASTQYEGFWDAGNRQYWVGYQWYGGIIKWYDTNGTQRPVARSPVNLGRSRGGWVLVADRSFRIEDQWWDYNDHPYWKDQPNHPSEKYTGPEGNNQAYVDGSVAWAPGEELIMVHRYGGGFKEMGFIAQQDLGFTPQDLDRAETYFAPAP